MTEQEYRYWQQVSGSGSGGFTPGGGTFPPASNPYRTPSDPYPWPSPNDNRDLANAFDPRIIQRLPPMDAGMVVNPDVNPAPNTSSRGQVIYDPEEMQRFGELWHQMYPETPAGASDRNIMTPAERQMMGLPNANETPAPGNPYQNIGYQDSGYADPNIEPTPFPPSGGYLPPHGGIDVPPNVFAPPQYDFSGGPSIPQFPFQVELPQDFGRNFNWNEPPTIGGDLPPSPDFPFTNYYPPDTGTAGIMAPTGNTGIYDPNTYTPFTDFGGGGGFQPSAPDVGIGYDFGSDYNDITDAPSGGVWSPDQQPPGFSEDPMPDFPNQPPTREGFTPMQGGGEFGGFGSVGVTDNPNVNYAYGPEGQTYIYDQDWNWVGEAPTGSGGDTGGGGTAGAAPGAITPNTYAPQTGGPTNPQTINPNDPNNNLTRGGVSMPLYPTSRDVFPQPSLRDELGRPTDWKGTGQLIKDAAGNIIDGTGRIIAAAGDAANRLIQSISNAGGSVIDNIMNNPGFSSPPYLTNIGYNPGQGTGSLYPAGVTGPTPGAFDVGAGGVGGGGGSFFHGSQYNPTSFDPVTGAPITDVGPSAMNPSGYNYPRHGAISIPGGGGTFSTGSFARPSALGGGNWQTRMNYVLRSIAGGNQNLKYPAPDLVASANSPEYRKLLASKGFAPPTRAVNTPGAAAEFAKQVQERGYLFPGHPDLPLEGPRGFARQGIKELGMAAQIPQGPLGHRVAQINPV